MTFGVELSEQAVVPGTEIPKVVQKCTEAIEAFGLDQVGIYRLSGTTSKVQALKAALDHGEPWTMLSWSASDSTLLRPATRRFGQHGCDVR
jgi:hypothetical protein